MNNPPKRKSNRLKEYDYSNPGWYYVTICTKNHQNLFGKVINGKMVLNDYGNIVKEELLKTKEIRKNVDLDYYVVMPNHIHVIIIIESRDTARCVRTDKERKFSTITPGSLSAIIRSFKSASTKRINELNNKTGSSIWQSRFYDHIIRNENDLHRIRTYIQNNPLKWELDEYYSE